MGVIPPPPCMEVHVTEDFISMSPMRMLTYLPLINDNLYRHQHLYRYKYTGQYKAQTPPESVDWNLDYRATLPHSKMTRCNRPWPHLICPYMKIT